jgi:hypothetical protein
MSTVFLLPALTTLLLSGLGQQPEMAEDVGRMVRGVQALPLMPWSRPSKELDQVVRHGKAVVPLLIVMLPDDPDDPPDDLTSFIGNGTRTPFSLGSNSIGECNRRWRKRCAGSIASRQRHVKGTQTALLARLIGPVDRTG